MQKTNGSDYNGGDGIVNKNNTLMPNNINENRNSLNSSAFTNNNIIRNNVCNSINRLNNNNFGSLINHKTPSIQNNSYNNNKRPESINSGSDSLSFVTRIYREQLLELLKTAEKNNNHLEAER